MFSLVKFHNEQFCIVPSKNLTSIQRETCIVKHKGAKYAAFLIAKSDNNTYLQDLKRKNEINIKLINQSKSTASVESCGNVSSSHSHPPLKTSSATDISQIPSSENKLVLLIENDFPLQKKPPSKRSESPTQNNSSFVNDRGLVPTCAADNSTLTLYEEAISVKALPNNDISNRRVSSNIKDGNSSDNIPLIESNIILSFSKEAWIENFKDGSNSVLPNNNLSVSDSGPSTATEKNKIVSFENDSSVGKKSPKKRIEKLKSNTSFIADISQTPSSENKLVLLTENDFPLEKKSPTKRSETAKQNYSSFVNDSGLVAACAAGVSSNIKNGNSSDNIPLIESNIILSFSKEAWIENFKEGSNSVLTNNNLSVSDSGSSATEKNKIVSFENDLPVDKNSPIKHIENLRNNPSFDISQIPSLENKLVLLIENDFPLEKRSPIKSNKNPTENNSSFVHDRGIVAACAAGNSKFILYEQATSDKSLPSNDMPNSYPAFETNRKVSSPNINDTNSSIYVQIQSKTLNTTKKYPSYIAKERIIATNELSSPEIKPFDFTKSKNKLSLKHSHLNCVSSLRSKQRSLSLDSFTSERIMNLENTQDFFKRQKLCFNNAVGQMLRNTKHFNAAIQLQTEIEESTSKSQNVSSFSNAIPIESSANILNNSTLSEVPENTTNLADLSSVNMEESTISEYVSNSSAHMESLENSKNNTTVEAIDVPLDITKIVVPNSKAKAKKHFCIFCHTLQCKISRHIFLKHKKEIEVRKALHLPAKSKERLKIIGDLRKRGDFLHNTSVGHNSGILIVPRRQQIKFKNTADDYICCKKCKGFFSKRTLKIHIPKCTSSKNNRSNVVDGRRLTQYMHSVANDVLKCKVFPVLRNDDKIKAIRYDELVIKYGNKLVEKYASPHHYDMIRAQLRLLGRFKLNLNYKFKPKIEQLKDMFKPQMFDRCIQAVRKTAQWDADIMGFKTPAVAQQITSLIKKCAKKQRAEFIKENNEDLKTELDNFLILWEEETPTLINKKALEDQTNKKRDKKVVMPCKEDIKKLYNHLKYHINKSMENLMSGFSMSKWIDLVEPTLTLIQIFNRRRAGEIERITIENFSNKESIADTMDKEILKKLSNESIKFAKQFVRIALRGKLGRTVSVLLCPTTIKAVELILKYRSDAGITKENNYIFSKPTTSKLAKQYFRACPLLKKFSEECGAQLPESLRGTNLRKHIATYTSLLNAEEAAVDKLANFMGHSKDIHKSIYRVSVPVAEITCISKLLMGAIGDEEEAEDDDITDEDAEEDDIELNIANKNLYKQNEVNASLDENSCLGDSFEEDSANCSSSSKKRRSTSPFGKTKRIRWNIDERAAIVSAFGDIKALKSLPSLNQCIKAISEQTALKERTPQQVKSWIDNQRRYKTDF